MTNEEAYKECDYLKLKFYKMEEVLRKAMDWELVTDENLASAIYDEVEKDPEGFIEALLKGLLPMIDVGESPLTGEKYKGFSIDGAFEMKVEC